MKPRKTTTQQRMSMMSLLDDALRQLNDGFIVCDFLYVFPYLDEREI